MKYKMIVSCQYDIIGLAESDLKLHLEQNIKVDGKQVFFNTEFIGSENKNAEDEEYPDDQLILLTVLVDFTGGNIEAVWNKKGSGSGFGLESVEAV